MKKKMRLRRYGIEFPGEASLPPGFRPGCGVTAFDRDDAFAILRKVFGESMVPMPSRVVENIDITTLDQGHVISNMADVTRRGVWFPGGY